MSRFAAVAALSAACAGAAFAGPLNPPAGPVAATHKTMSEVEPRIAINATNTPGDANSLFRISQPRSYYLTGNIEGQAGMHGIEIASSDVTLDLNGFSVAGAPGSLDGISTAFLLFRVTVRNGSVHGWGEDGIDLTQSGPVRAVMVENVHSTGNSGRGVNVGLDAIIRGCTTQFNGGHGFQAIERAVVESCVAYENNGSGFHLGERSVISDSVAAQNGGHGIEATYSAVRDCVADENGLDGIRASSRSLVQGCTVEGNGANGILTIGATTVRSCVASNNTQAGIYISNWSRAIGNSVQDNAVGIRIFAHDNRAEDNHARGNDTGYLVESNSNFLVRNTASANTTNWSVVAGNVCLVVSATSSGAINGNSGGVSPGSTNPNANYTY